VLIQMAEMDPDAAETHLVLGTLFRRRGETGRAIRIHQNLIARPNLERSLRAQAMYELGEDYLKAGLLDRAENIFVELTDAGGEVVEPLQELMRIYQQEREWRKAIEVATRLERAGLSGMGVVMGQYYCELAEEAWRNHDTASARRDLHAALQQDDRCVRASTLAGRLEAAEGNLVAAIASWQRVEHQDPELLDEVIGDLVAAYRARGEEQALAEYLAALLRRRRSVPAMLALADLTEAREGRAAALRFLLGGLKQHYCQEAVVRVLTLLQADGVKGYGDVTDLLLRHASGIDPAYVCRDCGFVGGELRWQCPSCQHWATLRRAPCGEQPAERVRT